jgi:dihydroorotate dehydrogenase
VRASQRFASHIPVRTHQKAYNGAVNTFKQKTTNYAYKRVAKPLLFRLPPDKAHAKMVKASEKLPYIPIVLKAGKKWFSYKSSGVLAQELLGIRFGSPVGLAAGLDKNGEMMHVAQMIGCGFSTVGSVTYEPRTGNRRPWFHRLPNTRSIVVHAGMPNKGLVDIAKRLRRRPKDFPVFVSVAVVVQYDQQTDESIIDDVIRSMKYIAKYDLAQAVEINISCPNVRDNEYFADPARLDQLLSQIDALQFPLPVFLKMPNRELWEDFEPMLDVVLRHNVQGLTIANLVKDRGSVVLKDPLSKSVKGGISGPPTRQRSTELIRQTRQKCGNTLVLIGLGGVSTVEDAFEKLQAGADLVELATGLIYEGPQVVNQINSGLEEMLKRAGYKSIRELHKKSSRN